ncbi:hypothetical protein NBRC116602_09540 [Hyphomicrobiales bacterium 4NK60-0047b]|jgi:hypothetical protein
MPFSNIVTVVVLLLFYFVFNDKKQDPIPAPTQYELRKKIATQYAEGCKSFDELSDSQRKRDLSYQTKGEFCMKAFFTDHPLGLPSEFLSAQKLKQFENHLKNDHCKQAEQILWQTYKKRYPKVPPVNFQRKNNSLRLNWRFYFLTKSSPATLFCLTKNEFETAQKIIEDKKLQTTPISNLNNLYRIETPQEAGRDRKQALFHLYRLLAKLDHQATQLYFIDQTVRNQALALDVEPFYFLLKRLDIKGHLPEKYKKHLITTKAKLTNNQRKRIETKAENSYISTLIDFPLKRKNK